MEANVKAQIIRTVFAFGCAFLIAGCATHLASGSAGIPPESGLARSGAHPATATITVTSTADSDLGTIRGTCPAGKDGELRYAMCTAAAGDTIAFDTMAMCADALPCTIVLHAPLPPIENDLTIDAGRFGKVVIDGDKQHRAFFVDTGVVTIAHLEVRNAAAIGGDGGGRDYPQNGGGGGAGLGAGLFVNQATATVHVVDDYFVDLLVQGGNGNGMGRGRRCGSAGGGGLGGNGGQFSTSSASREPAGSGGGGVLGDGGDAIAAPNAPRGVPGAGGFGGGGGGACDNCRSSTGGAGYGSNPAGKDGGSLNRGGEGGFGGGGGGAAIGQRWDRGGDGGFGGGGGGGAVCFGGNCSYRGVGGGGNGGPGGGGGGSFGYPAGLGGTLGGNVAGLDGDATTGVGGGGAAAGPAIFVAFGAVTTERSGASNLVAIGGKRGSLSYPLGGSSDVPVFNYAGTVNGSTTTGPVPGALSDHAP